MRIAKSHWVVVVAGLAAAPWLGCSRPTAMGTEGASEHSLVTAVPSVGGSIRVGGDMTAEAVGADGDYRSGPCRIDTPLPVGYPSPTPPGAIELKSYPGVRRAIVRGQGSPDSGMNQTFWPLFNHIKKHEIAMTSPVEMNYTDLKNPGENSREWSMAFLYRTPELNSTGREGAVAVEDAPPLTVVAIGLKGDYSMDLVDRGMRLIEAWLASHPEWTAAGSWRSLYYNGPSLAWWNKWAEVQLPVRSSETPSSSAR